MRLGSWLQNPKLYELQEDMFKTGGRTNSCWHGRSPSIQKSQVGRPIEEIAKEAKLINIDHGKKSKICVKEFIYFAAHETNESVRFAQKRMDTS